MSTLNKLNKPISTTSQKLTSTFNKDSVLINSKRNRDDLNRIGNFINKLIVPSFGSLTSIDNSYPYDVVQEGISGLTVVSHPYATSRSHEIFWKKSSEFDVGRPKTIKESFDYVLENLNSRIVEIQESTPDLSDITQLILCNTNYVKQLRDEIYSESYILNCGLGARSHIYTLSTHMYNILHQLTIGMQDSIIEPYNINEPAYPTLTIPWSRIVNKPGLAPSSDFFQVVSNQSYFWQETEDVTYIGEKHIAGYVANATVFDLVQARSSGIPLDIEGDYLTEFKTLVQEGDANSLSVSPWSLIEGLKGNENALTLKAKSILGVLYGFYNKLHTATEKAALNTIIETESGDVTTLRENRIQDALIDLIDFWSNRKSISSFNDVVYGTQPLEGYVLRWSAVDNAWKPTAGNSETLDFINELKDVDTGAPAEGDLLTWDASHVDPDNNGQAGAWVAKQISLNENIGQRLGGLLSGTSTLDDVYDMSSIIEGWQTETGNTDFTTASVDEIHDFVNRIGNRYRPGAMLQYGENDTWYSSLAGNISNLNTISLVPEMWGKGSSFLASLSLTETETLIEGSLKPIPFVFVNSFRVSMKEILSPEIRNIVYNNSENETGISFLNVIIADIYADIDSAFIQNVFNTNANKSSKLLSSEMSTIQEDHPLGMTMCSLMHDSAGTKDVEYKPNYLLGMCRSDLSYLPEALYSSDSLFIEDQNEELTGEISGSHIDAIIGRVVGGIGTEIQHSGYSRAMILGPYNIGDNVYICPEPILRSANIFYPYGICISDSFLKKSILDLLDPTKTMRAIPDVSNLVNSNNSLFNGSLYSFLKAVSVQLSDYLVGSDGDLDAYLSDELLNNMLSNPVGFIVKDDSPRSSNGVGGNLSNTICRKLLGDSISSNSSSPLYTNFSLIGIAFLDNAGVTSSLYNSFEDIKVLRNIFEVSELSLPVIKIQLPSFKYDPSIHEGEVGPAGTDGNQGDTGPAGPQGTPGSSGSVGPTISMVDKFGTNYSTTKDEYKTLVGSSGPLVLMSNLSYNALSSIYSNIHITLNGTFKALDKDILLMIKADGAELTDSTSGVKEVPISSGTSQNFSFTATSTIAISSSIEISVKLDGDTFLDDYVLFDELNLQFIVIGS
jgi:hypothetical protein